MTRIIPLVLVFNLSISITSGQTSRYWSLNLASEPFILAGAVVGSNAENQSVYYNPANIYENEFDNISFSGDIVSLDFYKAENAFGKGFDFKNSQFNFLPSFFSLFLKSKKNKDLSYQIALFTRDKNDFDVMESFVGKHDINPTIPGLESFSNLYGTLIRYADVWIGGGLSYKLSDKFSIGFSSFISVKKLDDKLTKSINILPDPDSIFYSSPDSAYMYSNAREISRLNMLTFSLQTKIGVQYSSLPWSVGLNISLPSIPLFGNAKRYREFGINNIYDRFNDQFLNDVLIVGSEKNLSSRYKDPLSIALGINYSKGYDGDMLGLSIEYFHRIPVYPLASIQDVSLIGSPILKEDPDFLKVWHGARSLVNVAVGYRKYINPGLTLLGGFRTDFDYLKGVDFSETTNINNQFIRYYTNVYHLTTGARFNISQHKFIIGAQYSFGREDGTRQVANFIPEIILDGINLPVENLDEIPVTYSYNGVAVFFGFIFNFLDKSENRQGLN